MAQSDRTATSTTTDCPAFPFPHFLLFLEPPPPPLLTSTTSPSLRHDRMKLTSRFPHFFRTPPSIRSLATHTLLVFLPTRTTFLGGRRRQAPLALPCQYTFPLTSILSTSLSLTPNLRRHRIPMTLASLPLSFCIAFLPSPLWPRAPNALTLLVPSTCV